MYVDPDGLFWEDIGKWFGAGIGLIGKDLTKSDTWNQFAEDAVFIAAMYAGYSAGAWFVNNVGVTVTVAVELPYVGQVNLASMNFGAAAAGAGAGLGAGAMGGGETKKSRYEDPGLYLPDSGPGQGSLPGSGGVSSEYQLLRAWDNKPHLGTDFNVGDGYVYARYGGVVRYADYWKKSGYGNTIRIERDGHSGQYNMYAHLDEIFVKAGDIVVPGQQIGIIGNTGGKYARHLHYAEYTIDPDGKWRYWDSGYRK